MFSFDFDYWCNVFYKKYVSSLGEFREAIGRTGSCQSASGGMRQIIGELKHIFRYMFEEFNFFFLIVKLSF